MLVLHGIYDHGKVEINEKDLSQEKADVDIIIKKSISVPSGRIMTQGRRF